MGVGGPDLMAESICDTLPVDNMEQPDPSADKIDTGLTISKPTKAFGRLRRTPSSDNHKVARS
jgi:hypothetical protein